MEWKTGRSYGVKTAPDLENGLEHQKKNQKNNLVASHHQPRQTWPLQPRK